MMADDQRELKDYLQEVPVKIDRGDPASLAEAAKTLAHCHSRFTSLSCFSASGQSVSAENNAQLKEDFLVARETLELSVLLAIRQESDAVFDHEYAELFGIYFNQFVLNHLPLSSRQALIMSVAMVWHLARDDLEQFHLTLHRVNGVGRQNSAEKLCSPIFSFFGVPINQLSQADRNFLQFTIDLERHIMDGNVARVMNAITNELPDERFSGSVRHLINTLRNRQALSLEASYERIPIKHAMEQLAFRDLDDLLLFIDKDRRSKERQMALLSAAKLEDQVFAAKWIPTETPLNVPERPGTPNALPRAGEGKVFANLARTSSSGGTTRTFSLKKHESHHPSSSDSHVPKDVVMSEPILEIPSISGAAKKNEGTELVTVNQKQRTKLWMLTPDREYIFFREMVKPRPLIPAQDLLRQFLSYAVNLEAVV